MIGNPPQSKLFRFAFVPLLLLIACWLSYGSILNNEYMLDDGPFLRSNYDEVYKEFSDYFTYNDAHHYIPVYFLVNKFLFDHFKHDRRIVHGVSIMLFWLSAVVYYVLLVLLIKDRMTALLAAFFLVVHPINAFTVNYITANIVFISAIFVGISLILFWLYVENARRRPLYFVLSILSFWVSLITFEASILLPVYVALVFYILKKDTAGQSFRAAFPFLVAALVYLGIWMTMAGSKAGLFEKTAFLDIDLGQYVATFSSLLYWYVTNLVFPFDIVFIKNMLPIRELTFVWVILFGAVVLLIGFLIVTVWKRSAASMALLWFVTGFLLVAVACLNHAGMGFVIEPHWLFLSSWGFFLLIALLLRRLKDIAPGKMWFALIFLLAASFGILTQTYSALARTEKGYCEYWLERSPGNAIAILRLGELAYFEGDYAKAERHLRIALGKFVRTETKARISHNLGVLYKETGNNELAVQFFRQAIAFVPDYEPAHAALKDMVP